MKHYEYNDKWAVLDYLTDHIDNHFSAEFISEQLNMEYYNVITSLNFYIRIGIVEKDEKGYYLVLGEKPTKEMLEGSVSI
jgi:hypothetical protein